MSEIDLHTHSTASDGTDSPSQLVEKACAAGLRAIALTDHDTIGGLDEASEAACDLGIELIRGCEISTRTDLGNMHMLGLFLPADSSRLEAFLQRLRDNRDSRNNLIIEKLNRAGLRITVDEVRQIAGTTIGRPHIAAVMLQKGYCETRDEAFSKWLDTGGKAFVPKPAPTPEQALAILAEIGATTCLAHPLHKQRPLDWLDKLISRLESEGLDCLEVWHSSHDAEKSAIILDFARKYRLGASGGSDYHGKNKPGISLGTGKSNLDLGYDILENLKRMRKERNLPH